MTLSHSAPARWTDGVHRIDARCWSKLLTPGASFTCTWTRDGAQVARLQVRVRFDGAGAELIYSWDDALANASASQSVGLARMPAYFGGSAARFMCPTCARRVAVFYAGPQGFACRSCQRLGYRSMFEPKHERLVRCAEKVREQLGWSGGILSGEGTKPAGMQERTFRRLVARHRDLRRQTLAAALARLG